MKTEVKKNLRMNQKGTTFIELLLYVSIFLILTPILLTSSINSVRLKQQHTIEKNINADSQFIMEKIYDLITSSKRVDVDGSQLGVANGILSLILHNDSLAQIAFNEATGRVEITEGGVTSAISPQDAAIHQLYFDKIPDNINDPDIVLGLNINLKISGIDEYDLVHDYIVSANLELGDYDEDGSPDFVDEFPREEACSGDADSDGICDEVDNCIIFYNPVQDDHDLDGIGDDCDTTGDDEGGGGEGGGGGEACQVGGWEEVPTDFSIFDGVITPQQEFKVTATVVGAAITSGSLQIPVTTSIRIGDDVWEPWGDINKPVNANINDGNNPRTVVLEQEYPAGTEISARAQSWNKPWYRNGNSNNHWYVYLAQDSNTNTQHIWALRRGDDVPNVPGLSGQGSLGQYLAPYVDDGEIIIGENDVIFLFELGTTNLNNSAADFQDLVLLLTIDSTAPQCINEDNLAVTAYSCNAEDELLELIYSDPPLPGNQLGGNLIAASPLAPSVLQALINTYPNNVNTNVFRNIMYKNTKLPDEIMTNIENMSALDSGSKWLIISENDDATEYAWESFNSPDQISYSVAHQSDAVLPDTWENRVRFYNPNPAPDPGTTAKGVDMFSITAINSNPSIDVTVVSSGGTSTVTLNEEGDEEINDEQFLVKLTHRSESNHKIIVTSENNAYELEEVIVDFGSGANVTSPPSGGTVNVPHFVAYCEGGCSNNCGDVGVGVAVSNQITDQCYMEDSSIPEWCLKWLTTTDDNSENPAYVGGTQIGEASAWWQKDFTSILSDIQELHVTSITVETELAYQNTNGFFCDTLASSCPMEGNLAGPQDVELFDWDTSAWEKIGELDASALVSDQQVVELMYEGANPQKFIHPENGTIRVRMNFNWNGVGEESAPSFMVIDYLTVHLKW